MNQGLSVIVYPVTDLARAKALYSELLGGEPYADTPYYVGFRVGNLEVGLDPNGHRGAGPVGYAITDDIKTHLQSLLDAGAQVNRDVTDVGGGRLTASVTDADGNVIGLTQLP
jgi:predicted enzyme related to lactoylglutathione lyase